jgi:hypothetical protein
VTRRPPDATPSAVGRVARAIAGERRHTRAVVWTRRIPGKVRQTIRKEKGFEQGRQSTNHEATKLRKCQESVNVLGFNRRSKITHPSLSLIVIFFLMPRTETHVCLCALSALASPSLSLACSPTEQAGRRRERKRIVSCFSVRGTSRRRVETETETETEKFKPKSSNRKVQTEKFKSPTSAPPPWT